MPALRGRAAGDRLDEHALSTAVSAERSSIVAPRDAEVRRARRGRLARARGSDALGGVDRDREADADAARVPLPPVAICELMPITRPAASSSGPPELPGLIAASVWITSLDREAARAP